MPPEGNPSTIGLADAATTVGGGKSAEQALREASTAAGKWLDGDRPGRSERPGGHGMPRDEAAPEPKKKAKPERGSVEDDERGREIEQKLRLKRGETVEPDDDDEDDEPRARSRDRREERPTKRSRVEDDADEDLKDEEEADEDDDLDDEDDAEDEDDDEDEDLTGFRARYGIKTSAAAREARTNATDDFRATLEGRAQQDRQQQDRPRNDGSDRKTAPQPDGSDDDVVGEEALREIEEFSPHTSKAVKALVGMVRDLQMRFADSATRQAVAYLNKTIDAKMDGFKDEKTRKAFVKQYGYGRSVTQEQRERRHAMGVDAFEYQRAKMARQIPIDDDDAIDQSFRHHNRERLEKAAKRGSQKDIERSVRKRQRTMDLVPGAGSIARGANDTADDGTRSALKIAGQWLSTRANQRRHVA